jgi:DNA (cytosine-5)-methyltransferase 1
VSAIAHLKPKFFSLENVRGYAKFEAFKLIVAALRSRGYAVEWRLLDSADYGVPQNRKRLWLLARLDDSPAIPWPTHADADSLQPSLFRSALPHVGWGSVADIAPMAVDGWSDRLQAALPNEPIPGCLVTGFKDASGNFSRPLTIRRKSQPSPTLLANMNRPSLLPWVIVSTRRGLQSAKRLTVPHMSALQGFPIGYQWGDNVTRSLESIGNAVSPPVMCAIALANIPKHVPC